MKKLLTILVIVLIFCNIYATDTIIYQSTVTLNSDFSAYDDVEVVATNGINLGAGFAYSSDGSGVFSAIGNPYVFDVPSGSSSSTGGDSVSTGDQDLDYILVVGSVNGDAGVSIRGAATYNIPITVPKGTNGMGPQLSISYNSQVSASGVLGRSWNLNGVSSITTTGSNYYYDGKKGAISHSDSLSFLMWDGQRLFGINAKGLEADSFKTENKSYCRIEKKSGGNGDYFEIKTPDGNTLIYGQAFSAQMHFNDTTEWMWLLETVEDRNGNEISYTYSKDASKNRILLTKIEYGGSSLNPINEIEFHYSEKARISYAYILNNLVVSDQQLDSISMKSNGTFIGAFTMDYQISGTEMLLCEINQYDKDNNRYNPTKVNWETPSISVVPTSVNTPVESGANFIYYSGDYNGDGFSDLISLKLDYVSNQYVYYLYEGSTAGLPSTPSDTGALPRSYTHQFWDDMNTYATDNCSGSYDSEFEICDIVNLASGDFDGDGLDELMIKTMEWNAFAPYLPEDLNSVFTWLYGGFNSFKNDICDYTAYFQDPLYEFDSTDFNYRLGKFIHFDKSKSSEDRITVIRLEDEDEILPVDSRYPDIKGVGYSPFIDNGKVKYYDIENHTAWTFCNSNGGHVWDDLNGDDIADRIIQEDGSFRFGIRNPLDIWHAIPHPVDGTFLGTIDLNGDGTSAYAYLGPCEYDSIYYREEWEDYCTEDCGGEGELLNPDTWNSFLDAYDIEDLYNSYVLNNCGGINNVVCVNDFLDNTVYVFDTIGRKFIIDHLEDYGREIDFGYDYFDPSNSEAHALGTDLNADGKEELLLFDGNFLRKIIYNFIPVYETGSISYSYSDYTVNPDTSTGPKQLMIELGLGKNTRMGDFNGDGIIEFITPPADRKISFNTTDQAGICVSGIKNGLGQETRFHYKPLTDEDVYTKGTGAVYPVIDFTAPWFVVSSMARDNGCTDPDSTTFSYKNGKIHVAGKGFLGFMETSSENHLSNSESIAESSYDTVYYQPYPKSVTQKIDGNTVRKTDYYTRIDSADNLDLRIFKIRNDSVRVQDYLNNTSSSTANTYNSLDQVIERKERIGNVGSVTENYTYENGGWFFPYLPGTVSKQYARNDSTVTDSTRYEFNNLGQPVNIKQYAGTDRESIITFSNYNTYGIPGRISKSGKWGRNLATDSLWLEFGYTSCGRFMSSVKGPLNNNMYFNYNLSTGLLSSQTTVNDFTTNYTYGPFGSLQKRVSPDMKQSYTNLYWSDGHPDAPSGSLYYSWTKSSGNNEVIVFYDASGRTLRTVSPGFNDETIYKDAEYDSKGRLIKSSLPYEKGNTPLWSTITYDHYGRVDEQVDADSTKTEYDYGALWQKVTISKGSVSRSSEVLTNALGETIESKDAMGNVVYSSYYPDGRLKESYTSVHPAHKTSFTYDAQGNRTSITDPDAGTVTSLYDSFGKLLQEINAKGDTTTFEYDKLGRVIKASDARGEINYMYISDTTDAAFGQADSIYHTDGSQYESFTYDDTYGRLLRSTRHMPGKTFTNSYTYDWFGRLWTRTYPSGFEVQYAYTDGGHLEQITGEGKTIWSCNDVNELGQITSYSQGSYSTTVDFDPFGVLEQITTGSVFNMEFGFDDLGNLTSREDVLTSQKEVFDYDNLNRLTGIDYYLNDIHQSSYDLDIGYNNDGNISSKTDVGTTINYGEDNAGPHALTSVENPVPGYKPPPQVITYTCFNKVSTIQDTIGQDTTLTLAFTYGINNQRVKTVLSRNSSVERIKYFDGDYEEDSTSAGTKKYHYISAPTGLVGIFVSVGDADTLYHVLSDNLGSINAVINSETNEISKYSYSAWGIPRDPDDWTSDLTGDLFAGRGYTGHEHLLEFSLINMNGRVYDPVLARFLSPDPFVQFPGMADGHNRYAYALNNPLIFIDPTGYTPEWIERLWEWIKNAFSSSGSVSNDETKFDQDSDTGGGSFTVFEDGSIVMTGYYAGMYFNAITNGISPGYYIDNNGNYHLVGTFSDPQQPDAQWFFLIDEAVSLSQRGASSGQGNTQELIPNSDVYWGITGTSWLWSGTAALNAPHFRVDAASKAAGKFAGKIIVGLNVAATAAEGYDLVTNWDQAGRGDVAKFGVDATIVTITTILYLTGVGTPVAIILTGVQVANTLGAFDFIYESFNKPLNNGVHGGGGSW